MSTCHQCGSDVAENVAFCPYCGISLEAVGMPDQEDDEFASTIIISPEVVSPVNTPDEPRTVSGDHDAPASAVSATDSADHAQTESVSEPTPDFDDMPTPPALAELERSAASSAESKPSEVPATSSHGSDESISVPESIVDDRPHIFSRVENTTPTPPFDSSAETSHAQSSAAPPEEVPIAARVYGVDEPIIEAEPEIFRPDEILQIPDAGPSEFDSVRIIDDRFTPTGPRTTGTPPVETPSFTNTPSAEIENPQTSSAIGTIDTGGRRSAKLKPLDEGVILNGRYEIVRKIGGGGMGAVYLASDNNLGGVLRAVKEMVQAHIEEQQQAKAIEDFKRESLILSQLDHPSIPTIYDYFFDGDECRFYLVMKYISGGDLAARLRAAPEGRIDEKTVTEWGIQIADVLDYLHSQPTTIVYRDLKPSNIMIDGNTGRVMLIDFGIARSINQKQEKGVTAVGTMGYAPPELFSGNVEPRSDIYSLGSTMFHLLTGADPQSNPLLIFDFQKNPRPRQINSQLSDQIERFIMRAVEYNAGSRFESAAEVKQILTDHLANLNKGVVTFGVKEVPESVGLANQPVFCGFCGQRIVATDLFCAFCGAKQPIAQQGVHSEIYGRGAVTAKLLVEGTSELPSPMFSLDKSEILIGRRDPMSNIFPEVDLSKYDPQTKISRRHARIWRQGNTYLLEDLGSSNGTVLVPIVHESIRLAPRQPHALTNGDKIRVGDTTLHFMVG